jgi:hypothetical protein
MLIEGRFLIVLRAMSGAVAPPGSFVYNNSRRRAKRESPATRDPPATAAKDRAGRPANRHGGG